MNTNNDEEMISVPRKLILEMLSLMCKNLCNAGGYDKSILRSSIIGNMIDDKGGIFPNHQQSLNFEMAMGEYMRLLFEATGYKIPDPVPKHFMLCRCNGHCIKLKDYPNLPKLWGIE